MPTRPVPATVATPLPPPDGDCFVSGTRILTVDGAVPVENLAVGAWVPIVNESNRPVPVWWIGRRVVDCARHPSPVKVWPVRIAPHAFGRDLPARELWLSPDHGIYQQGVLIPARELINGATIVQVPMPEVTYWHVELTAHSIILAEALAVESYLDASNRAAFSNGNALAMLHPEFERGASVERECVPLVTKGPLREQVVRALFWQALALGWRRDPADDGTTRWTPPAGSDFRLPA